MSIPSLYEGSLHNQPARGKSFDDSEPYLAASRLTSRVRNLPENNLLKSFSGDKERSNNVAKIKVVVCLVEAVQCFF